MSLNKFLSILPIVKRTDGTDGKTDPRSSDDSILNNTVYHAHASQKPRSNKYGRKYEQKYY